jgi:hypothetical protein
LIEVDMSQASKFVREIQRSLDYLPTWLPTTRLRLGDIVALEETGTRLLGSIESYGIPMRTRPGTRAGMTRHMTQGAVSINVNGKVANAPDEDQARVAIEFSEADAILFAASNCQSELVENLAEVGSEVVSLFRASCWQRKWLVVTEVIHAKTTSVLISQKAGAVLESTATTDLAGDWAALITGGIQLNAVPVRPPPSGGPIDIL